MSEANTTAPVVRTLTINGKPLSVVEAQHSARSKEKKGRPLLIPTFTGKDGKATRVPSTPELGAILAMLGEDSILKAIAQAILAPLARDASDAATKEVDGKFTIDNGDFIRALQAAAAEFTSTTSKLDELRAKEAALNDEINKISAEIFGLIGKGQPVPQGLANKGSQLITERAKLVDEQKKKSGARGKKAAAPVAA